MESETMARSICSQGFVEAAIERYIWENKEKKMVTQSFTLLNPNSTEVTVLEFLF